MQIARFFVPNLPPTGLVELDENERRHATSVLRLKVGDKLIAFDGQGHEATATIESAGRNRVEIAIESFSVCNREVPVPISIAVALPKGDRQKTLIDGLTELGVTEVVPLITERGVAQPTDSALQRLERSVIEASKQCARCTLMRIGQPMTVSQLATSLIESPSWSGPSLDPSHIVQWIAHPYTVGPMQPAKLDASSLAKAEFVRLAIGPEGGFTDHEVNELADENWHSVSLGPRILRVEMAAIALASRVIGLIEDNRD